MDLSSLEKVKDLPALPTVAMRVTELINDPNSSSADIADVLRKDQSLTSKVLKLINSSYYSIPGGVSDVQRALGFLGFNTVAQLVLGISVVSMFKDNENSDFSITEFWRHALAVAMGAELIAKKGKKSKPEEAFTCGLLHDIGKLVFNELEPAQFAQVCQKTKAESKSFLEVERALGQIPHTVLGQAVAIKWGLPKQIQLAIRYHHDEHPVGKDIGEKDLPLLKTIRFANDWAGSLSLGQSGSWGPRPVNPESFLEFGLRVEDFEPLQEQLKKEFEKSGALLSAYR